MDSLKKTIIKGIPVVQNKQDFILGVFSIQDVLRFTKYTNRLITGFDENEEPIYNKQIQRFVENSRVQKIADFLTNDPDATFPTNIVLHIPENIIEEQRYEEGFLNITLKQKVFDEIKKEKGDVLITIIDGQHRIRGIEIAIKRLEEQINTAAKANRISHSDEVSKKLDFYVDRLKDLRNIHLVVSFFVNISLEYQAMIFSTINRTQKKVSADLVSSLFGLDTSDTPQKTALQVVLSLNGHKHSPFYKRIKLYGGDYSKQSNPPLSQATMVRSIVALISENLREAENDRYRKRKELFKRSSGSSKFLPFRNFYASNKDNLISDILFYYFNSVRATFKHKKTGRNYWDFNNLNKPDNILQTSVGYEALLKLLVDILERSNFSLSYDINQEFFTNYLKKSADIDFSDQRIFPFSTKGKNILYLTMNIKIWKELGEGLNDDRQERLAELLKQ